MFWITTTGVLKGGIDHSGGHAAVAGFWKVITEIEAS
jgi:hypothetical protein